MSSGASTTPPARRRPRRMGPGRWLLPCLLDAARRRRRPGGETHLILCVADHFEPRRGGAPPDVARARVRRWVEGYPAAFGGFRDSDGRPPRHTFFYPIDEYEPEHLDALAGLCRAGYGEVEVHLHHDGDDRENLRSTLSSYAELLDRRHGLLCRHRETGRIAYGFIHGNWCLNNSGPDGRWCGVDDELGVLRETGCYADFTMPSAPHPTQPRKVNRIYYAPTGRLGGAALDDGIDAGSGPVPRDSLLMIPGPLLPDWGRRKWGLLPRIENGCLQGSQPPRAGRVDLWLRARVQVPSRPDWYFVKLHTHGAAEWNREALLGEPMARFHRDLARRAADDPRFHFHYVTAREMCNLVLAAEAGWDGPVRGALDFLLERPAGHSRPGAGWGDESGAGTGATPAAIGMTG